MEMRHYCDSWDFTGIHPTLSDLTDATLSEAYLTDATLSEAYLTDATLTYADRSNAERIDADLSGSDFSNAYHYYNATWTDTFYEYPKELTWDSGMDLAWRSSVGILRTTPEPAAIVLALLGLALLPRRRRRSA